MTKTRLGVLCIDNDAIVILEVFEKKTQKAPREVIENCKRRIRLYDTKLGGVYEERKEETT